jgi:hypothetical protein
VARGKRERLFIAVMTRSASALLETIFAGFGELAHPLRIERMLETRPERSHHLSRCGGIFCARVVHYRGPRGVANGHAREKGDTMAKPDNTRLALEVLEPELDRLLGSLTYFDSTSRELRKFVQRVFFVHAILEEHLRLRIIGKLCEDHVKEPAGERYGLQETMHDIINKLPYTDMLNIVREFNDGAPCGTLDKINRVRHEFGHPGSQGWKERYHSKGSRVEVLQLLMVGLKVMEDYMAKVRREAGL